MTRKELEAQKEELCELRSKAIRDFKKFFKGKKEELEQEKESEDSEET